MEKKIKQVLINNMELLDEGTGLMGIPVEETRLKIIAQEIVELFAIPVVSNFKALYKCQCGLETNDYLEWKNCDCKS
jgi:hypothetical protein